MVYICPSPPSRRRRTITYLFILLGCKPFPSEFWVLCTQTLGIEVPPKIVQYADKVINDDKSLAVITDLGNYNQALVDELQGLDALLLEANHDINMLQMGSYPYPLKQRILGDRGHLSNERSGQFLCELLHDHFGTVLLGHLSKENNYEKLAYEAVRLEVTMGDNPYKAEDFPMIVAKRDTVSNRIRV